MAYHHNALAHRPKKRTASDPGEEWGFIKKAKASTPEEEDDDDGGLEKFVRAQSAHSDSSEGEEGEGSSEQSEDTVLAEERDASDPEEEIFASQYGEFEQREWYDGKGYTGNRGHKAKRLAEFQEMTNERLEDWLEGDLCPREDDGDGYKEEMDWALNLLERLVDLVHYVKDKATYNRLLKEQRSKRRGAGGLPQIREKEVNLVLQREIKKAASEISK
ncbi:hypothetical protein AC578_7616 [Pseudocercospora eumusae]|uniref:Uncharacterized protein n=1 Tax=Pseudocercospora eumusae TaxID=321146 RepID=A0A139GX53_9PEZI|nr:hypothetical protein AC578_7616 [Pseudocercospora eumusae]